VDPAIAALPAADGLAYTSYVIADQAAASDVAEAIIERSGKQDFPMTALSGYELGLVLDDAIGTAGSCSPRDVGVALAKVNNVKGLTGPISFAGGDGMAIRDMTVVQIRDGAPVAVFRLPAAAP
jgi:branched-chain amino acid transport system substrate-binding protein